ncbi:hypothetical protein SALBM135S_01594 [Streptomyces alboniger]
MMSLTVLPHVPVGATAPAVTTALAGERWSQGQGCAPGYGRRTDWACRKMFFGSQAAFAFWRRA